MSGLAYDILANYINDFVIQAKTKKKLEERIIQFLKIVEKHNLCWNSQSVILILMSELKMIDLDDFSFSFLFFFFYL